MGFRNLTLTGRALWLALAGAAVLGAVFIAGANAAIEWTNTESFCISCHEMKDNVYAEYQDTIHDKNRTGVRAICADCHVPRDFLPKMVRKIQATGELWGKVTGKIDTPEKFEEHRFELAKRVWISMKKNDSRECRACHDAASYNPDKQTEKARDRHAKGEREGLTCIDCHFAIAHNEPEGNEGPQDLKVERSN